MADSADLKNLTYGINFSLDDNGLVNLLDIENQIDDMLEKIGISTSTVENGLNGVGDSAKNLGEDIKSATDQLDTMANSTKDITSNIDGVAEQFSKANDSIKETGDSTNTLSKGLNDISNSASSATEQLSKMGQDSEESANKTSQVFYDTTDVINSMGEITGKVTTMMTKDLDDVATKGSKSMDSVSKNATESFGSMKTQMDLMFAGMSLDSIAKPLDSAITSAVSNFDTFDKSMRLVNTETDLSQQGFQSLETQMVSLSNETGISANDLSTGMYNIMSTGLTNAAGGMNVLETAAEGAKAGNASLDDTTKALDSVMGAYGLKATDVAGVQDIMFRATKDGQMKFDDLAKSVGASATTAAQAGVKYSELAAAQATLTNVGKDAQVSSQELNSLIMGMITPTTGASKEAHTLGIEWDASALKAHGLTYMIDEATKSTGGNAAELKKLIPNQRAWQASVILGSTANGLYTKTLNDMNNASGSTATALAQVNQSSQDSIDKATNSLKNAGMEMVVAFAPALTKIADNVSNLITEFNNLSPSTKSLIGDLLVGVAVFTTVASKIFMIAAGASALTAGMSTLTSMFGAVTEASTAVGVASEAGAVGMGGMAAGLGAAAIAAAPWILAGVAVVGTGIAIHQALTQQVVPAVDLFATQTDTTAKQIKDSNGTIQTSFNTTTTKISDNTKASVSAYMKMNDGVQNALTQLYVNSTTITNKTVQSLVSQYDSMGNQIKSGMDKHESDEYTTMQQFFQKSNALSKGEETNALASLQKSNTDKEKSVDQCEQQIQQILQTASNQHRSLTLSEQQQINAIQDKMKNNAVNALSDSEVQSKVILQRIKDYGTNITDQQASAIIKNANKQRDGSVQAANDQYNKTLAAIIQMRDGTHAITSSQADKLIADAKRQKDGSINQTNELHDEAIKKVTDMNKNISASVSTTTGDMLTWWDKLKSWWSGWNPSTKSLAVTTKVKGADFSSNSALPAYKGDMGYNANGTDNWKGGPTWVGEKGPEILNVPQGSKITPNSKLSNVPHFATGTSNSPGGLALVGEKGPELVELSAGSKVTPNNQLTAGLNQASSSQFSDITTQYDKQVQSMQPTFKNYGQQLNNNLGNGLTSSAALVSTPISSQISNNASTLSTFTKNSGAYGQQMNSNIGNGIQTTVANVYNPLTTMLNNVKTTLQTFATASISYGTDMITQIGQGISASEGKLSTIVSLLTTKVVTLFKQGFGIHSPSTVMFGIGNYLMQGLANGMTTNDMTSFIAKQIGSMTNSATGAVSGNVTEWLMQAIQATGQNMNILPELQSIAMHESGGNPSAVNLTDSNAQAGHPSQGLMQMIPGTFAKYELPGHGNIDNGEDNAISSIRYMLSEYGSISNVPGIRSMMGGGSYVGYENGTSNATAGLHLVGEAGPELLRFNGGEQVIPNAQTQQVLQNSYGGNSKTIVVQSSPTFQVVIDGSNKDSKGIASEVEKVLKTSFSKYFDSEMKGVSVSLGLS